MLRLLTYRNDSKLDSKLIGLAGSDWGGLETIDYQSNPRITESHAGQISHERVGRMMR
jgi:hypothetical protein